MKKPWYQRTITFYLPWVITGFVFIGSILDTVGNTTNWITPSVTVTGTIVIVLNYVLLSFCLKRSPLAWITENGQKVLINRVGIKPKLVVIGVLVALWLPRVVYLLLPATPISDKADVSTPSPYSNIRKLHGLNLLPYFSGQSPCSHVDGLQLKAWINLMAPYTTWVKTYAVCDGLEKAGQIAHEDGLRVALGAWLDSTDRDETELVKLINSANAGHADILIVGNEFLTRHRGKEAEIYLINCINKVKSSTHLTVTVTTAEPTAVLAAFPNVISAVDALA
jgi:hypothetical protein